jgi:hypothetical protein
MPEENRYNLRSRFLGTPQPHATTLPPADCEADETISEIDIETLRKLSDMQIVNSLESLLKFTVTFQKMVDKELSPALRELVLALSGTLNHASPIIRTTKGKGRI